jgi:hypothetical protein
MEQIIDGRGRGHVGGINSAHQFLINGVTTSAEHYTNLVFQDSYNMIFNVTPSAGGMFLHLQNHSDNEIICEGYSIYSPSDEIITILIGNTGTPIGGTDVVPANLTAGSGNIADGVFQIGNNITGMSGGVLIAPYHIAGSNDSKFRNFDADVVIPKNQSLCMMVTNGGINIHGFLVFWHDHSGNGGID